MEVEEEPADDASIKEELMSPGIKEEEAEISNDLLLEQ